MVSVITPVYAQAAFLPRAVASLLAQDTGDWELVVIDDGSPDEVAGALPPDPRIRVERLPCNGGLGAALNRGLDAAQGDRVAYLPADDVWHRGHLAALGALLDHAPAAHTARAPAGAALQLVQLGHRATAHRWLEREAVETDDLARMGLDGFGPRAASPAVTCTWTQHPAQRHRALRPDRDGGPATFRRRYRVHGPLRLDGVDEAARYAPFAGAPPPPDPPRLRVLLAGELAYNPERILALEALGCRLSGLWIDDPLGFMTVGPLPFGHIEDVEPGTWRAARPDVVYALLNWRAVPLAHRLLGAGVPLVFHFKEAPQRSLERGDWPLLADVATRADELVLSSEEERDWFCAALPGLDPARVHVLDGDLPKREWLDASPVSPRLSDADGEVHTVLLGRPYGFDTALRAGLAQRGIRVHEPRGVGPHDWVRELSRYDAGWLHPVAPANGGDVRAALWDDLNVPARLPTLLAAGLPLIAPAAPPGAVAAAQRLASELGCGVLYADLDDLAAQLRDQAGLDRRRRAAWAAREEVTFDRHAGRLLEILEGAAGRP